MGKVAGKKSGAEYLPGEVKAATATAPVLKRLPHPPGVSRDGPQRFALVYYVYGFAPGKHTFGGSRQDAKQNLRPLIAEMTKKVRAFPAKYILRDVHVLGFTDRVPGSRKYDDAALRRNRANSVIKLLKSLIRGHKNQPKIFIDSVAKNAYFIKGGTAKGRRVNRGAYIVLKVNVPNECKPLEGLAGANKSLKVIQSLLKKPEFRKKLAPYDRFWVLIIDALIKGSHVTDKNHGRYYTEAYIKQFYRKWYAAFKKKQSELKKLPSHELTRKGIQHGLSIPPKVGTVAYYKYLFALSNKILKKSDPELFVLRAESLIDVLRKLVNRTCSNPDAIVSIMRYLGRQIIRGRASVQENRNIYAALLRGLIPGSRAGGYLDNSIDRVIRNWLAKREAKPNSIYSILLKVIGKKKR